MVKRTAVTRVISFLLLAACGALCRSESPSASLPRRLGFYGLNVPQAERQELTARRGSFPDAPLVHAPTQAEKFHAFVEEAGSPLTFGAVATNVGGMRGEKEQLAPERQPSFTGLYGAAGLQKESSTFFSKYLYPSLLKQDPRYHPSTSDSTLGRAAYAASGILITRNDSGKTTLNTLYILGVLTSTAVAPAYRPYGARSTSTTLKNFGSTIGSDAGISLFHEFWPGIRQVLKGHSSKLVQGSASPKT